MTGARALGIDGPTADLVRRACAGEEAAFVDLVRSMHADLLRVSFVVCGDPDLAEDAVQAAWIVAWRKLHTVRDRDRVRPWLVAIAANEARQMVRRRRRRMVVEIPMTGDLATTRTDPATRSADVDLANALGRLDPADRMLLALRYVAGLKSDELAQLTGSSASGTRSRLARLTERMRRELRDA